MDYTFTPVALVRSPFRDKFGVPRQPSLAPSARQTVELLPPFDQPDAVRGLDAFSHLWLQFLFHQTAERGWQPLVRPPRLGGNRKVGVFASRATHRPNPLGLSLVRLHAVDTENGVRLHVSGADLVDGTPVLDIKPYIPFVEAVSDARAGFVDGPPPRLAVRWQPKALQQLALAGHAKDLVQLAEEVLAQDPRPAYQQDPDRVYGVRLYDCDVRFRVADGCAEVLEIVAL